MEEYTRFTQALKVLLPRYEYYITDPNFVASLKTVPIGPDTLDYAMY